MSPTSPIQAVSLECLALDRLSKLDGSLGVINSHFFCFRGVEIEAQNGKIICLRSHNLQIENLGLSFPDSRPMPIFYIKIV